MATITLTLPDDKAQDIKDAVCRVYGYDPATDGTPNAFVQKVLKGVLRDAYKQDMVNVDEAASRARTAAALAAANFT